MLLWKPSFILCSGPNLFGDDSKKNTCSYIIIKIKTARKRQGCSRRYHSLAAVVECLRKGGIEKWNHLHEASSAVLFDSFSGHDGQWLVLSTALQEILNAMPGILGFDPHTFNCKQKGFRYRFCTPSLKFRTNTAVGYCISTFPWIYNSLRSRKPIISLYLSTVRLVVSLRHTIPTYPRGNMASYRWVQQNFRVLGKQTYVLTTVASCLEDDIAFLSARITATWSSVASRAEWNGPLHSVLANLPVII